MSNDKSSAHDFGYGTFGDRSCYWEGRDDGKTDIFPGGMPSTSHNDGDSHEHVVVDADDNVVYWRDADGEVLIDIDED